MSHAANRQSSRPSRRAGPFWGALAAALIGLVGLAAYSNSFHGGFVLDDTEAIKENPTIRHLWPLQAVLFPKTYGATKGITVEGRPLLNLSLAINYAVGGLEVRGYHAVNLAVHLLAGMVLFGIVRRTLLLPVYQEKMRGVSWGLALVVALVWVVHPLQTESVTYLCQRAESLAGLFYLLTLYLAIRGFTSNRSWVWQAGSVLACIVGITAKEVVATAPLLVFLHDYIFVTGRVGRSWRLRWKFYLALALSWGVSGALLVGTGGANLGHIKALLWQVSGHASQVGGSQLNWLSYALTQFGAVLWYLRLSVWPSPLILDYGAEVATGFREVVVPAMVVGLLLTGTVLALRRRSWVGYAGAWFFLILAPTSSVVPLAGQTIAEHRMYLSLAAVVVLVVVGAYAAWRRLLPQLMKDERYRQVVIRAIPAAATIVVLLVLGRLTLARNVDYRSEYTIMLDTVRKRPTNHRAHNNLGFAYAEQGKIQEAIQHFERGLQLKPDFAEAHNNLGYALAAQGKLNEAMQHHAQALQLKPDYADARYNLGNELTKLGRLNEAVQQYELVLQLKPDYVKAHGNLGAVLITQGKLNEGIQHCERALQLKPDSARAHYYLGVALTKQGKLNEAILHFEAALRLKPNYVDACYNLGDVLAAQGKWNEAGQHYERAIQVKPDYADAHNNLGNALAASGKWNEAISHFEEALRLRPDMAEAHGNWGGVLANQGKLNEAIQHFQQALNLATAQGNAGLAEAIRTRLESYQSIPSQPQTR